LKPLFDQEQLKCR